MLCEYVIQNGYYLEAILMEYAAIESRLESVCGVLGLPCGQKCRCRKDIVPEQPAGRQPKAQVRRYVSGSGIRLTVFVKCPVAASNAVFPFSNASGVGSGKGVLLHLQLASDGVSHYVRIQKLIV